MLEYGSSLRTLTRASPTEGSGAGKGEVLCQTSLVQHQKVNISSPIPALTKREGRRQKVFLFQFKNIQASARERSRHIRFKFSALISPYDDWK